MIVSNERYGVRQSESKDIPAIITLTGAVYPMSPAWTAEALRSHQSVFPEGQLVVFDLSTGELIGMAASLIVLWDNYEWGTPWKDFTDSGMFTNHDPQNGRTLYGAEIMIHPKFQGTGAGSLLYRAREEIVRKLKLLRIRAGARLSGYHRHAGQVTALQYLRQVVQGKYSDPTLSFQLKHGFKVLRLVENYLIKDPESLGYAAVIEWINQEVATPDDTLEAQWSPFH
jgi:GNAT superfamily N-acetyltransferase